MSEHSLACRVHSPYLRHFREIADGGRHASAMKLLSVQWRSQSSAITWALGGRKPTTL